VATFTHTDAHGNDFLLVDAAAVPDQSRWPALARRVCDRATGIGADGLIFVTENAAGAAMQLRNADGSYSEVSGNGVRCLAAWLADRRGTPEGGMVTVVTDAGAKVLTLMGREGTHLTFRAAMGEPQAIRRLWLDVDGAAVHAITLSVGNPQCVVLGEASEAILHRLGGRLAVHPHFPAGTNVEFAEVESPSRVRIRIWERGVGPTASSGTGTCAAAVAAACFGGADRVLDVEAPGGMQRVEWLDDGLFLTGWATVGRTVDLA
jgi:diaminopimelate epimerase